MKLITPEEFFELEDIEYATVEVPEWNRSIRVCSLNADEILKWLEENQTEERMPTKTGAGRLLGMSWVNEDGTKAITTPEALDKLVNKVKKLRNTAVNRIYDKLMELNGMKKVEEAKNG